MVRSPYFWLLSTARQSYQIRFDDGATTFSERLRCPVHFDGRRYDNLTAVWNAYYRAYRTHLEPAGAAFVRLEDLVEAPMTIVRALGQHLKLLSSPLAGRRGGEDRGDPGQDSPSAVRPC
jgi:hypothetical protein